MCHNFYLEIPAYGMSPHTLQTMIGINRQRLFHRQFSKLGQTEEALFHR